MSGMSQGVGAQGSGKPQSSAHDLENPLKGQDQDQATGTNGLAAETAGQEAAAGGEERAKTSYQQKDPNAANLTATPKSNAVKGAQRFAPHARELLPKCDDSLQDCLLAFEKGLDKLENQLAQGNLVEANAYLNHLENQLPGVKALAARPETNPHLQLVLGRLTLARAKLLDRNKESRGAIVFYQKSIGHFNQADQNSIVASKLKPKILMARSEAKLALRDYEGAMADEAAMNLATHAPMHRTHPKWQRMAQALRLGAAQAKASGDSQQHDLLFAEAIRIESALGMELSDQAAQQTQNDALNFEAKNTLVQFDGLTQLPEVSPIFMDVISERTFCLSDESTTQLYRYVAFESDAMSQKLSLKFSPQFEKASIEDKLLVLSTLQGINAEFQMRHQAPLEIDPVKKAYLEGKVALLEGNLPLAKAKMNEVWEQRDSLQDPALKAMAEDCGEQLRQFALAHLDSMESFTQTLYQDRHEGAYEKSDTRDDRYARGLETVDYLRALLRRGDAHTLKEAIAIVKAKAQAERESLDLDNNDHQFSDHFYARRDEISWVRRVDSFLFNSENPNLGIKDPRFHNWAHENGGDDAFLALLQLETPATWETTQTADAARAKNLEVAGLLRKSLGDQVAAIFYEGVMRADYEKYETSVAKEVYAELIDEDTLEKLQDSIDDQLERIEEMKEDNPKMYRLLYSEGGPTKEQKKEMLTNAIDLHREETIKQRVYQKLDEAGFSDEISAQAWSEYQNMTDILDETFTLSDDGYRSILAEATVLSVTLPATVGVGATVRGGLLASRAGQAAVTSGRAASLLFRTGNLIVGSAFEGAVQEAQISFFTGRFNQESFNRNMMMSLVFHTGMKAWNPASRLLQKEGAALTQIGKKGEAKVLHVADKVGMLQTQTLIGLATEDPAHRKNLIDAYLRHMGTNIGFHVGTATMREIAPNLMDREANLLAQYAQAAAPQSPPLDGSSPPPSDRGSSQAKPPTPQARARAISDRLPDALRAQLAKADPTQAREFAKLLLMEAHGSASVKLAELGIPFRVSVDGKFEAVSQLKNQSDTSVSQDEATRVHDRTGNETRVVHDMSDEAHLTEDPEATSVYDPALADTQLRSNPNEVAIAARANRPAEQPGPGDSGARPVETLSGEEGNARTTHVGSEKTHLLQKAKEALVSDISDADASFLEAVIHEVEWRHKTLRAKGISEERIARGDVSTELRDFYAQYQAAIQSVREQTATLTGTAVEALPPVVWPEAQQPDLAPQPLLPQEVAGRPLSAAEQVARDLEAAGKNVDPEAGTNAGPVDLDARTNVRPADPELKTKIEPTPIANDTSPAANNTPPPRPVAEGHGFMPGAAADASQTRFTPAEFARLQALGLNLPWDVMGGVSPNPVTPETGEQVTYSIPTKLLHQGLRHLVKQADARPHDPELNWAIVRVTGAFRNSLKGTSAPANKKAQAIQALEGFLAAKGRTPDGHLVDAKPTVGPQVIDENPTRDNWVIRAGRRLALALGLMTAVPAAEAQPVVGEAPIQLVNHPVLEADFYALRNPRRSLVGKVDGLTAELETSFDRGARVIKSGEQYYLVESVSGGHTSRSSLVNKTTAKAYQQWYQAKGFKPVSLEQARNSLDELQEQARRRGINIQYPGSHPRGQTKPDVQDTFLQERGAQIVYLNELFKQMPESFFDDGVIHTIHLDTPRQGTGHLAHYNPGTHELYLYQGLFNASRRTFMAGVWHELGHVPAQRLLDPDSMSSNPNNSVQLLETAHQIITSNDAHFGLDILDGAESRKNYQASSSKEFMAEVAMMYRVAGPQLRAHVDSFAKDSPVRLAWDHVLNSVQSKIYSEKDCPQGARPQPHTIDGDNSTTSRVGDFAGDATQHYGSHAGLTDPSRYYKGPKQVGNDEVYVNEDAVAQWQDGAIVVDGMGGYEGGDVASAIVVRVAPKAVAEGKSLVEALRQADQAVRNFNGLEGEAGAVAMAHQVIPQIDGTHTMELAWVGDARAVAFQKGADGRYQVKYQSEDDGVASMVFDQNLIQSYLDQGYTPQQIDVMQRAHPQANIVASALGGRSSPKIKRATITLAANDVVVMGSDGLWDNISPQEVAARLDAGYSPKEITQQLLRDVDYKMSAFAHAKKDGIWIDAQVERVNLIGEFSINRITVAPIFQQPGQAPTRWVDETGNVYADSGQGHLYLVDKIKGDNVVIHAYQHDVP